MEEPAPLTPEQLVPYFGALALMATADGDLGVDEIKEFTAQLAAHEVPEQDRRSLAAMLAAPPPLGEVVAQLRSSPCRFSLYLDVLQMAHADGVVDPREEAVIGDLQRELGIAGEEAEALRKFAAAASKMREAGDGATGAVREAVSEAAANVVAVGVPIAAVAASGSVWGLSAAGITSGLAALGLGFGMVSGIGTCVALGFVGYRATKWLLSKKVSDA